MPHASHSFNNDNQQLTGGQSFKENINKFVQRYIKDRKKAKEIREKLIKHQYLDITEHECAEHRFKKERSKSILIQVEVLKSKIREENINQIIPKGTTGQVFLTVEKFGKNHKPQYLDLLGDCLLLKFERHPQGGTRGPLHQYWLFEGNKNSLYLIPSIQQEIMIQKGEVKRFKNGKWQSPSDEYKIDFEKILKKELGHKSVKAFQQITAFREDFPIIESIPKEVCDFCFDKIGVNIQELERNNLQKRGEGYNNKYGHLQGNDIKIDFASIKLFGKYNE